jgi:hypothetical protein
MRALVPLVFQKGGELKDRWMGIIRKVLGSMFATG